MSSPRSVDHLVLPVSSLEIARERLAGLGFTVAPDAVHPFGTENCCVFFADDTFLEPLAVAQRETCEAEAQRGNVFVARDQAYRFRCGQDGFSALVMATDDARNDHAQFVAEGLSAGDMFEFSRPFTGADGAVAEASFRLAFAADLRSPDSFFFTCQRVAVPAVDRRGLQKHANGVLGIAEVVMTEPNPSDFQYVVQEIANERSTHSGSFGISVEADGATLSVLSDEGFNGHFATQRQREARGLELAAVVFQCSDVQQVADHCQTTGIVGRMVNGRFVVEPASGQGALFAFETMKEQVK